MFFYHANFNVKDLNASVAFYRDVLGLKQVDYFNVGNGALELVFMGDERGMMLELTCVHRECPETEFYVPQEKLTIPAEKMPFHIAFYSHDYANDLAKHKAMGLVVDEEPHASVYFIRDPEGYLVEIGDGALYDNIAKQTQ